MIKYGKFDPIPGDDVIGFVTRGRGLTVLRMGCHSLPLVTKDEDKLTLIGIYQEMQYLILVKSVGMDYKGLLKIYQNVEQNKYC